MVERASSAHWCLFHRPNFASVWYRLKGAGEAFYQRSRRRSSYSVGLFLLSPSASPANRVTENGSRRLTLPNARGSAIAGGARGAASNTLGGFAVRVRSPIDFAITSAIRLSSIEVVDTLRISHRTRSTVSRFASILLKVKNSKGPVSPHYLCGKPSNRAWEGLGGISLPSILEPAFEGRDRAGSLTVELQEPSEVADTGDGRSPLVEQRDWKRTHIKAPGKSPRRLTVKYVVQMLQSQSDAQLALNFFQWAGQQTGYEHSSDTYCALIEVLGDARRFDVLDKVRVEIEKRRLTSSILLATLARTYCLGGRLEESRECLKQMKNLGCCPNLRLYNKLVHILVKTGHPDQAYSMYKTMLVAGCCPDSCTFNNLLNGFGKAGKLDKMETVLEEMELRSCKPTAVTIGILVDVLCKAGRQDEAYTLFSANKHLANVIVYNAMLHGLGKIGRIEQALELFQDMRAKDFVPQVNTWNILIQSLGLANRYKEALNLFRGMTSQGMVADLFTYNLMLNILIKGACLDDACRLFEEMTARRCMPDIVSYSTLIYGYGEKGDVDNARKLFIRMEAAGCKPNAIAYGALIGALCKGGNLDEGIIVFEEMKAAGFAPDKFVSTNLSGNLFKAGRFREAQRLFEGISDKDSRTYLIAYNAAIDGLGHAGEIEKACRLFQEMLFHGCIPDVVTYNTLLAHLGKSGNLYSACQLFHNMQASGCSPDVVSYSSLVDVLCKQGQTRQALGLFEDMRTKGISPNMITYQSLISGLCKARQFKSAYSLYKEMTQREVVLDEVAYRTFIQSFSSSVEYVDEGYKLFQEMIEKGYSSNSLTSYLLTRSLKKAGKFDEAAVARLRVVERKSREHGR